MATGRGEGVPTPKEAAVDRIQAIRARIGTTRTRENSDPVENGGTAARGEGDLHEATFPCDLPAGGPRAELAQRDATIAALRAEIAILRREVAVIAAHLAALGADPTRASSDD